LPPVNYKLFWHSRCESDKGQQWLRQEIATATQRLLAD